MSAGFNMRKYRIQFTLNGSSATHNMIVEAFDSMLAKKQVEAMYGPACRVIGYWAV